MLLKHPVLTAQHMDTIGQNKLLMVQQISQEMNLDNLERKYI